MLAVENGSITRKSTDGDTDSNLTKENVESLPNMVRMKTENLMRHFRPENEIPFFCCFLSFTFNMNDSGFIHCYCAQITRQWSIV